MNELINTNKQSMTLKEITDLLEVRHDQAMKKVAKMAKNPDFGTMFEIDIAYNSSGQTIRTYQLNERQSIAVASMLNVSLLMRVIDRWQELEKKQHAIPQTYGEALQLAADQAKQIEQQQVQLQEAKPKVEYHDKVLATTNGLTTTEVASELGFSAIKLNRILEDMKVQRKIGGRWVLTAHNLNKGYTVESTFVDDNEKSHHTMKWTEKGRKFIFELMEMEQ